MRRFHTLLALILGLLAPLVTFGGDDQSETARGIVFEDANSNGKLDEGEQRLSGVRVSNGRDIVRTNDQGEYSLAVDDDDILFVIKPRGWRTPLSETKLPRFYYIHKPHGSPDLNYRGVLPTGPLPKSVDFPLYKQDEPERFRAIMFGDPQPRDQKEIDYIAHDVVEELIGSDAAFGVTLGDIMFDNLDLFESMSKTVALIGIPWYNVIGNHDINYDAKNDATSDETFERNFGPAYYSFDYGPAHFMVLDDVQWYIPDGSEKGRYRGGLGKEQMQFIRNDLKLIPEDQLVVLMMHIPLVDVEDRQELYRLIEQRPACMSLAAHTHKHRHHFITKEDGWMGPKPHHHITNVTVSGSWWSGAPDERGIPHTMMADGAPNGYSIMTFDGATYQLDFKAAGRPADYQMEIHAPEVVAADKLADTVIYANVFNGSERSKVEFRVGADGNWIVMEQTVDEVDPKFIAVKEADEALGDAKKWRDLPGLRPSSHLWKSPLPASVARGTYLIQVRATDRHGRIRHGRRTIRVN